MSEEIKIPDVYSSTNEHITYIINNFKKKFEENLLIKGSKYEVYIGQGLEADMSDEENALYSKRIEALNMIQKDGLIRSYEIKEFQYYDKNGNNYYNSERWFAECLINEDRLYPNEKDKTNLVKYSSTEEKGLYYFKINDDILIPLKRNKSEYKILIHFNDNTEIVPIEKLRGSKANTDSFTSAISRINKKLSKYDFRIDSEKKAGKTFYKIRKV